MSRKAYKILTDLDLSRNKLLNVSNIEGPAIDNLSKDLKIHADKGNLRIETTSGGSEPESKGNITLGIRGISKDKTSISINPDAKVSIEDNDVTVNGTGSLVLKSKNAKDDNSITLTSKDNTIAIDADIIKIGSEKDYISTVNEYVNSNISTINEQTLNNSKYTQTVSDNLSLTTNKEFSITAEKTLKVVAGKTGTYEGKFDANKGAYLLNIETVGNKFESTETVDNLRIRNSQKFEGYEFDIDSTNIFLDASNISIGTGTPLNTSLKIYGNGESFKLEVENEQSEMTLKDLHTENLEIFKNVSLNAEDNNNITVKKSVDLKTPKLTLGYENGNPNVLTMETSEDGSTNTSLDTDRATISNTLTSNAASNLSGTTTIAGTLNVNNELIEGDSTVEGTSLTVDSKDITLGKKKTKNLKIKTSENIVEETPSKTLETTTSYTHTAAGTYKVVRAEDFEINALENDSYIKANTLKANNNVQIGSPNSGVDIYWDNLSKSLVFTKWE